MHHTQLYQTVLRGYCHEYQIITDSKFTQKLLNSNGSNYIPTNRSQIPNQKSIFSKCFNMHTVPCLNVSNITNKIIDDSQTYKCKSKQVCLCNSMHLQKPEVHL